MDSETFFYVVGGALVLIALGISFVGMRDDDFPSPNVLRAGVLVVALVVVATAAGAVLSARAEQQHRMEEENLEAAEAEEELTAENEASGAGEPETPENSGEGPEDAGPEPTEAGGEPAEGGLGAGDPEAGATVFADTGCGGCHTLAEAGDAALGQTGPNLDEALLDEDPAYIEASIVDPGAVVAEGYGDGIMPTTYDTELTPEDLQNLVAYLAEATSRGGN